MLLLLLPRLGLRNVDVRGRSDGILDAVVHGFPRLSTEMRPESGWEGGALATVAKATLRNSSSLECRQKGSLACKVMCSISFLQSRPYDRMRPTLSDRHGQSCSYFSLL